MGVWQAQDATASALSTALLSSKTFQSCLQSAKTWKLLPRPSSGNDYLLAIPLSISSVYDICCCAMASALCYLGHCQRDP